MAGVNLQGDLLALHNCLRSDVPVTNAQKAHDIVGDIGHACLQDVTGKDIDYCCSLLFAKDNGVATFLRTAVKYDEYQSAKVELVEVLRAFVTKWPLKVTPYSVDIKDACVALFSRDKYSKVKSTTISLLIEVIKLAVGTKAAEELQIGKLIEKFFLELTKPSKHTATVKHAIYHLLGVCAEMYPEQMAGYSERLLELYMKTLKSEMTSKTRKPELSVIAGCLQGLSHYLVNFTQSADEGARYSYDIFKASRMAFNRDITHSRYEMPKAGLQLLTRHAPQFNQYIIDDYEALYESLKWWSGHHNTEVAHLGMSALETCLTQVAEMLVDRAKEGKTEGATFKYFIHKFRAVMDNPDSTSKEVSLAIQGYGLFAAPCKLFLSTQDVQFMFNEMMQRSDQIFFSQSGLIESKLISLPSFLNALASIIKQLDEVSETFLWSLERLVVVLIENIPKINVKMHYASHRAILHVFLALMPKGPTFKGFISRIVYQSLIRSCSHPVLLVTEETPETSAMTEDVAMEETQKISYRDYLELWKALLNSSKFKNFSQEGVSLDEHQALADTIYDELVSSALRIIGRLDLASQRDDDEVAEGEDPSVPGSSDGEQGRGAPVTITSDPVSGLHASKPKDFIIFINLVDFCRDLLSNTKVRCFKRWIFTFGHEVVLYSTKFPLVSGFYKLLSVCTKICSTIGYFKPLRSSTQCPLVVVKQDDSMDVDVDQSEAADLTKREACFMLFSKFTKEVLTRIKQYKDDLLASCLTFILSLPQEIVEAEIKAIVPALKMTLRLGQSYLVLAMAALEALERWTETLPPHVIQPHYRSILPCLDPYLCTRLGSGAEGDQTLALTSTGDSRKSGRRKIPIKLLKQSHKDAAKGETSQLAQVQLRCVRLLGSLGGSINHYLVTSRADEVTKEAVAWDSVKHLKFDMPFMDIKPTIYFDVFLPRITEVATMSSDRQAKVAACELLHSMVIYMVGRGAQKATGETERHPMEALYRRLFPIIITLACDVEQVATQLFEPLMFQLIHWFTGNKKYESEETMALLDTLIDGIVDPTDTARRDFSARCLQEFLAWSIKQTSKKQMERSPMNIKSLLKRLYSLARHPSAFKRLGAALAFNSIYTIFREEDSLVDRFTFEVLVNFINSLALAHNDDKSLGTQEQCRLVLTHLERIIKVKAKLLTVANKQRIIPKEWNDATLLIALRWLLRQCGRPHTECRHAAMELVYNLAPCLPQVSSAQTFFSALMKESGPEYFILRFERGRYKLQSRSGLVQCPSMASLGNTFTLKSALAWFDILLSTLDCYTWAFGQNLLSPAQTLIVSGNKGTVLFKVLAHFLNDLALDDVAAAAMLFKVKQETVYFTPREAEEYNRAKCTVIVRIMDFLMVLLGAHQRDSLKVIPGSFWTTDLWKVIILCVLDPCSLGFNMADVEVMTKLPEQTKQLLQVVTKLPANITHGLRKELVDKMAQRSAYDLAATLPQSLSDGTADHFKLLHLARGYTQLQTLKLLAPAIKYVGDLHGLAEKLLDTAFMGITSKEDGHLTLAQSDPATHDLAIAFLDLAFTIGLKARKIVEAILDKTPVRHVGCKTSEHGAMFYSQFHTCINRHLVAMVEDTLPVLVRHAETESNLIGAVLAGVLDTVSRDRNLRKREGTRILSSVMAQWRQLESWWGGDTATQETKIQALSVLTKAILIDGKVVSDVSQTYFGSMFDMYQNLLVDKKTQLTFKSRVMDLLSFFVVLPETQVKKLKIKLDRVVADNFPMKSSEFRVGSPQYNDYITALNKILSALEVSGSLMLLELVISIMCREARHVHEDELQMALTRFVKRLPMDKHKLAVDVPYNIFKKEGCFPNEIRRAALDRVCLTMLRLVHKAALTEFFCDHIKEIITMIETKVNKTSENILATQLTSKACAFELIEVMYSRLPKDEVSSKNSRINAVFCNNSIDTGKEMTTVITRLGNLVKSEDCRGESLCGELQRQCHCAAYNALIADICCTQTDIKFYNGFLFAENLVKGQLFFDNLVDPQKTYTFQVEMETPLARRRRFVSIRNEIRDARHDGTVTEREDSTSVHYLASQYLADSSLSTDISQFDFGASAATMSSSSAERRKSVKRSQSDTKDYQEAVVTVEDDYVEMEMDELNQHECMATMTAMLQHMMRNNITPAVEKGVSPTSMPVWMDSLLKKLQHHSTSANIKLFIAKLIVNSEEVFRPYAKFWLVPIAQLIVTGQTGSPGIHYFIVDLVVTILSWHTVAIPEDSHSDRGMATRMLEFLMENCHHDTRRVLRNNLDVIKTLVEVWKTRIDVPIRVIYQNFSQPDVKSISNATGIQMLGVILTNKLPPYRPGCGVDKDRFFQHLAMNMTNSYKTVYAAAAEVVGMSLQYLSDQERGEDDQKWRTAYIDNISKMLLSIQNTKPDILITCVHKMQLYHKAVADRFLSKVVFMLPRLHGEFRQLCLEIIASRAPDMDDIFTEMKTKGLVDILTHRDEGSQQMALKLVKAMLPKLKPDEVVYVLPSVSAFTSHPSTTCRAIMYDIFMWMYDNYRDEDSEAGHQVMTETKGGLLSGLSDEDLKNRLTVQNFWSHETRLPTATIDRMVAMLEAMYSPSTESQYLAYATNLLLEMTSKSPDYNRMIYEHPLSECKFEDYHISSSWRQRHAVMTPLFVATQMSQTQGASSTMGADVTMGDGDVRATQDVAYFTPTQQAGGSKGPYNWLTQSSLDTYSDQNITLPVTGDTQSSLLFTVGKGPSTPTSTRTFKEPGPGFGKGRLGQGQDKVDGPPGESSQGSVILRLKKRFLKEQDSSRVFFMKRQIRLNKLREEMKKEQKARRENTVSMYRKYRKGDLPDIQINYSYIIAPLQALAQRDNHVARLLFASLFKAIFAEIEKVKTDRESREIIEQIGRSLNMMLSTSTQYFPSFIACVLDIALEFPRKLKLEASNVNTACITSQQQPLGIVLLEETLLLAGDDGEERPAKRARGGASSTQVSRDTTTWIELARLYKSLGDYDVLQGIFSAKVGSQKITLEAMEAEMRGDYKTALTLYNQGLSTTDWEETPPNNAELDLWDISRLECCANLTNWSHLEQYTSQAIDDNTPPRLDRVWEDTYDQEHYLPLMIRGRLKLLMEGSDQQALLDFVDAALRVPERKALLESSHCEELAMMYLWQEDYDRARHYTTRTTQLFLQEWSSLNRLMTSRRRAALRGLQKLTELQEFLDLMSDGTNLRSSGRTLDQLKTWLRRSPDPIVDPTAVWDDIVTNRCVYIDHLSSRLEGSGVKVEAESADPWSYHKVLFHLAEANSTQHQLNFPVALYQMRYTQNMVKAGKDVALELQWSHTNAVIQTHRVQVAPLEPDKKLRIMLATLEKLNKSNEVKRLATDFSLGRQHQLLKGEAISTVTDVLQAVDTHFTDLEDEIQAKVVSLAGQSDRSTYEEVVGNLIEQGYQRLKLAVGIADREASDSPAPDMEGINDAHLAFVRYCDKYVQQLDQDEGSPIDCPSVASFRVALVTSLLTAMKNGSVEARQRFPRLLQIVEKYPDTLSIFIKKASEVPCWMFLGWVSQLTAVLDKRESPAVQDIILRIAEMYPQAIVYPFKLSCDGYNFDTTQIGRKSKEVKNRVEQILSENKLVNAFISALEQFGQPNSIFKDWTGEASKLLVTKSNQRDPDRIKQEFRQMYRDLMDQTLGSDEDLYGTQDEPVSQVPARVGMGKYRKKFAQKFVASVEKLCGKDGSKLLHISCKSFRDGVNNLMREMEEIVKGTLAPPGNLKEYSLWLSDFQASNYDQELELPGQYTGLSKPLPEYHTKISSFDERVLVMSSIRKPKRVTIRGNDEREYMFLVKGGEDLRQDQRIEQLFAIMNDIFTQDAACRQRHLELRTYQVVPMTPRVGIIEWMKKTKPLKDFLFDAMTEKERRFMESNKGPQADHVTWIQGNSKEHYWTAYETYSRSDTVTAFRRREDMVPWNLSRRAYQRLSASMEAYFTLRSNFAVSHALVSLCQYIIGIGDRHLSNFMVDMETGRMVGIDFGHAFGSATQFLPIPELIPFRLTRQLRNLMLPLREKGSMEGTMVHALRALRQNSNLLLATMDIFIKEPSIDWQQNADRQRRTAGMKGDDAGVDSQWYPKQKIEYAQKKLEGSNPAYIMREELALGHKRSTYFKHMERVLMGDRGHDIRARLPPTGLTVEQQVASLLNHATDPNILGRVYVGWNSWM